MKNILSDLEPETVNPLEWVEEFTVSEEEAQKIADSVFIIDGFIVQGHLTVVAAEPNGGKTTIVFHLAGDMAAAGYKVIYVHGDTSGGDAKQFIAQANQKGITLLLPDMKVGKSMEDIVKNMEKMNASAADLSGCVFIFDTLKKMADVINKGAAKSLLRLLRSLTAKGATIVLLAHTNKYRGEDGKPIYEGTGDIRSDCDNLVYLIPDKAPDGSMTVAVEPDKQRAALEKMTFRISPDRQVELLEEYQDVAKKKVQQRQLDQDRDAIERITEAIEGKKPKQADIIEYCKTHSISKRRALACLKRYARGELQLWREESGFQRNTRFYYLAEGESV